jgi:hypothetical protein
MYLGQLAKIRDELREIRINVILDPRDVDELRSREADTDISEEAVITEVAEVKVTDQVELPFLVIFRSSSDAAARSCFEQLITFKVSVTPQPHGS